MTSGSRFVPLSFRHFFLADIINLKTMARAVLRLRQPLVLRVRLALTNGASLATQRVVAELNTSLKIIYPDRAPVPDLIDTTLADVADVSCLSQYADQSSMIGRRRSTAEMRR